ncbi:MAG: hypothetical protein ACREMN_02160, partial [Gemmatimonadales bacterium]
MRRLLPAVSCAVLVAATSAAAQNPPSAAPPPAVARVVAEPKAFTLAINDTARIRAVVYDSTGTTVPARLMYFSTSRRSVSVDSTGLARAHRPGSFWLYAGVFVPGRDIPLYDSVAVNVNWPPIARVEVEGGPPRYYAGTTTRHRVRITDAGGFDRRNVPATWASDNAAVVAVDQFGHVTARRPGSAT